MPPAVRRASLTDALTVFTAQSDVVAAWAVAADLTVDSPLPGWTVRDVLAHLTLATERLAGATPGSGKAVPMADYVGTYGDSAAYIAGAPGGAPGDPRPRFEAAAIEVSHRDAWPATVIMWDDPLAAADAVVTRVIELVVHGLDLGIEPDRGALGVAVRALTGVLATRHPGRAVELRVAPFAAVQVLEGTVHRRGTPTAVVSCDPVPWVRLATGRLSWPDAEAAGSLTARGERSDLSAYLPLLS